MTSDTPGPGTPESGGSQEPEPKAPSTGEWPAELTPPAAAPAPASPAPAAPAPQPASSGTWGSPPAPVPGPPTPAPQAPATPPVAQVPSSGTWGQPTAPATPAWGQPASPAAPTQPAAPAPAQPSQWGAAATPPPTGGQWGAPPAPAPGGQPGGQWGAPPQGQPGGWAPGPGAPGAPPGTWAPAPAKSDNGCLKACLIVGVILVVIAIVGFIGLMLFARGLVEDIGIDPETGAFKACPYISDADIDAALGQDVDATPVKGFLGEMLAAAVDQRILPDADSCWVLPASDPGSTTGLFGRIAVVDDGNAASTFSAIKATGSGSYTGPDVSGLGDEAFCTGVSEGAGTGILVRRGSKLVFVSLVDPTTFGDLTTTDDGVLYSPTTCQLAQQVAQRIAR